MYVKLAVGSFVILLLGSGIFFVIRNMHSTDSVTLDTSTSESPIPDILKGTNSIEHLLKLGKSISCSFTYNNPEMGVGNGEGYFDAGRARIDAHLNREGKPFETHMIQDGSHMYTWTKSDEGNFAFMMPVTVEQTDASIEHTDDAHRALEEQVAYACDPWTPGEEKFVPPSDVQFTDLSRMMETTTPLESAPRENGEEASSTAEVPEGIENFDVEALEEMMQSLPTQQ